MAEVKADEESKGLSLFPEGYPFMGTPEDWKLEYTDEELEERYARPGTDYREFKECLKPHVPAKEGEPVFTVDMLRKVDEACVPFFVTACFAPCSVNAMLYQSEAFIAQQQGTTKADFTLDYVNSGNSEGFYKGYLARIRDKVTVQGKADTTTMCVRS